MGGCNERYSYDEDECESARVRREEREKKDEQRRRFEQAIRDRAEEIWSSFCKEGLAGIEQDDLDTQVEDVRRREYLIDEERRLRERLAQIDEERRQIRLRCIHLTREGKSAFAPGMYDICDLCGDMR